MDLHSVFQSYPGTPCRRPKTSTTTTPAPPKPKPDRLTVLRSRPDGRIYLKNGTHFDADLGLEFIEDHDYYYNPRTGTNYELDLKTGEIENEYGAFENYEREGGAVMGAHAVGVVYRSGSKGVRVVRQEGRFVVPPQVSRPEGGFVERKREEDGRVWNAAAGWVAAEGFAREVEEVRKAFKELEGRYENLLKGLRGVVGEQEGLPKLVVRDGTLENPEGEVDRYISCAICGDEHYEPDESVADWAAALEARNAAELVERCESDDGGSQASDWARACESDEA